jgi:uncharacterized protein
MSTSDPLPDSPEGITGSPLSREDEILTALPAEPVVLAPVSRPPHPHFGWALLWLLGFVLIGQGIGAGVVVVTFVAKAAGSGNPNDFLLKTQTKEFQSSAEFAQLVWPGLFVGQVASILFGWLALRLVAGKDWPRKVAMRRPALPHLGLTLLIFPALPILGGGVDELVKQFLPSLIDLEGFVKAFGQLPWWLGVLVVGLGPAFAEELFCRGFLGRGLVGSHGVVVGVLLTSLLFGIMHLEPRQVIYAPVIGVMLHFVYLTTRSLWMPILLHALNNGLGILAESTNGPQLDFLKRLGLATDHHPFLVYGSTFVLLLAAAQALYFSRARPVAVSGGPPLWEPTYPGVEWPPPGSGTTITPRSLSTWSWAVLALGTAIFLLACYRAVALG